MRTSHRAVVVVLATSMLWGWWGCDHSHTTGPQSESVVSGVTIKPLTGTKYQVTANVTNPDSLIGGTAQLQNGTAEVRRRSLAEVLASVPITADNIQGNVLTVVFTLNKPPTGKLNLIFLVIDASGHASNSASLIVTIKPPPGPTPEPSGPGTIKIKTLIAGSGNIPGGSTLDNLSITGTASFGPFTIPLGTTQTINNVTPGPYTASAATAYFVPCPSKAFTVSPGGTVTLTYNITKIGGFLSCTITVGSAHVGTIQINITAVGGASAQLTGLTLTGPVTLGPLSLFGTSHTLTNVPAGSYTASTAGGYFVTCSSFGFSVPDGGTVTLTYTETKSAVTPFFTCTEVTS